jgi:hypothetical protein
MPSVVPENKLTLDSETFWNLEYKDVQNKLKQVSFIGVDFHAMGKRDLGAIVETHRRTRLCDHGLEYTPS